MTTEPMTVVEIRPAANDDLVRVKALLRDTWHDTYDSLLGSQRVAEMIGRWHAWEVLADQIANPRICFLIALSAGEPVGHAMAEARGDGVLLLSRLYVLPGHQRRGIGARLLAAVMERHPGTSCVQLIVEARNEKALAFYGRHGFVVTGEVAEDGSKPLCMERSLRVRRDLERTPS